MSDDVTIDPGVPAPAVQRDDERLAAEETAAAAENIEASAPHGGTADPNESAASREGVTLEAGSTDVGDDGPGEADSASEVIATGSGEEQVNGEDAVEDAPARAAAGAAAEDAAEDGAEGEGSVHGSAGAVDDALGHGSAELKAVIEALIFASPDPLTPKVLFKLLADEPKEDVTAALAALETDYANRPGLQMVHIAGGYQIVTRPELHEWVRRLFHERSTSKLTPAALETLAVIAYKQPITALEITEIRGVNTSGVLTTLLERHLIKIVGRKNVVGRPFLYATTKEFLIRFGLNDLRDLPRIEDMAEALGFDPPAGLVEQTPQDEILPLNEES